MKASPNGTSDKPWDVISFTVPAAEYADLKALSERSGVALAHLARGIYRYGKECGERSEKLVPMIFISRGRVKENCPDSSKNPGNRE